MKKAHASAADDARISTDAAGHSFEDFINSPRG